MQRVGQFLLGRTLGVGSTGKVKLGIHENTGQKVAVKIVNKEYLMSRPTLLRKVEREIAVLKLIDHSNVLRLHDVCETTRHLFLILEYAPGGELFDYLVSKGRLSSSEALVFFQQMVSGVDCCHQHLVCHRDLKPENLLLDENKMLKIADFGMAALSRPGSMLATSCGSPHYASPEVVMGIKYDGRAADVWSMGVILFALITGKLPFDDENIRKLLAKVKTGVFHMPSIVEKGPADLIRSMICVDPQRRVKVSDIKNNAWFRSNNIIIPVTYAPFTQEQLQAPVNPLNDDGIASIVTLGFGDRDEVIRTLSADVPTLEKVFYYLYLQRLASMENPVAKSPVVHSPQRPDSQTPFQLSNDVPDDVQMDDLVFAEGNEQNGSILMQPSPAPGNLPSWQYVQDGKMALTDSTPPVPIHGSYMQSDAVSIPGQPSPIPVIVPPAGPSLGVFGSPHTPPNGKPPIGPGTTAPIAIPGRGPVTDPYQYGSSSGQRNTLQPEPSTSAGAMMNRGMDPTFLSPAANSVDSSGHLWYGTPRFHRMNRAIPDVMSPNVASSPAVRSSWFQNIPSPTTFMGDISAPAVSEIGFGASTTTTTATMTDLTNQLTNEDGPGAPLIVETKTKLSSLVGEVHRVLATAFPANSIRYSVSPNSPAGLIQAEYTPDGGGGSLVPVKFRVDILEHESYLDLSIRLVDGDAGAFASIKYKFKQHLRYI